MMTEQAASPAIGTRYPLLFSYRETFFGNGFVMEVQAVNGRALCIRESEDEYWVYGVNPGGMAAHGSSPDEAYTAFRKAFSHILVDLAQESESFEAFRNSAQTFFDTTNEGYEVEWRESIPSVSRGEISLEGISVKPANSPRSVRVTLKAMEKVTAQDNAADVQYLLAA